MVEVEGFEKVVFADNSAESNCSTDNHKNKNDETVSNPIVDNYITETIIDENVIEEVIATGKSVNCSCSDENNKNNIDETVAFKSNGDNSIVDATMDKLVIEEIAVVDTSSEGSCINNNKNNDDETAASKSNNDNSIVNVTMKDVVIEKVAVANISVENSYLVDNSIGESMMVVDNHNSAASTVDNLVAIELSEYIHSDIFESETNTSHANDFYRILSNYEMPSYPDNYNSNNYYYYDSSFVGTDNLIDYMNNLNLLNNRSESYPIDLMGNENLEELSVGNEKLKESSVGNEKLGESSVENEKLKESSVGNKKHGESSVGNEKLEESSEDKKSKRLKKDNDMKKAILTTINPKHRRFENMIYLKQTNLSNVFENCVTAKIRAESINCELLQHYFRTGAFLNKILEKLYDKLSIYPERSIITGMIKGAGIAKIFETKYVYSYFPNPFTQIYRADDILTPDAFMKIGGGGKNDFKTFVNEIKILVDNNYESYNTENPLEKNLFDFNLITDKIKSRVKKFTENPILNLDSFE
ncbi:hypothetical protein RclHR1_17620003 [Rhizophagus clarus]|uniref:Uncharacterized protein n=1 Tax=Rhizophagus clarus TaxID=94130 RepID=A0A2Z6QKF4_9GLOM|nr:hypothetical protein RclHR1_17620003 [Rhizophagus clarus]